MWKQLSNLCRIFDLLSRKCGRRRIVEFTEFELHFKLHMHLIPELDSEHVKRDV